MAEEKKKAPPAGILNFWNPKPEVNKETGKAVRPNKHEDLYPVVYKGQLYKFVIEAPSQDKAAGAIGALLKAILSVKKARETFEKQSIYTTPQLGPITTIVLGETTLYAKAGSLDPEIGTKMAIDRLAFALMECRKESQVDKMIETIKLRIVTNDRSA